MAKKRKITIEKNRSLNVDLDKLFEDIYFFLYGEYPKNECDDEYVDEFYDDMWEDLL